jgi:hypothetical protein
MAATSAEDNSLYGSATDQAWLALSLVDAMLQLKEPFFSGGIHIIRDRRPSGGDRLGQDFLYGFV